MHEEIKSSNVNACTIINRLFHLTVHNSVPAIFYNEVFPAILLPARVLAH